MPLPFRQTFARTLDILVAATRPGETVEAWTFDDAAARRAAERRVAAAGGHATFRSAYKPLVTFFREELELTDCRSVTVRYPVHPAAPATRFRLEAYPLAALLAPVPLYLEPLPAGEDLHYRVEIERAAGIEHHRVFAPNHLRTDHLGAECLTPTGWARRIRAAEGALDGNGAGLADGQDARLETDYEALFGAALAAVADHPWPETEPHYEELLLRVRIPAADEPLGVGHETLSLAEAMHEELYFSILEGFGARSGRPPGDRRLRPGQIVPEVAVGAGPPEIEIALRPFAVDEAEAPGRFDEADDGPPSPVTIAAELDRLGGVAFQVRSRAGRPVWARHFAGSDAAVMISAAQHANETTGIAGALAAAGAMEPWPGRHFTLCPLENPDGHALHRRLCGEHPAHMHHAARYTALGDDLEYREAGPDGTGLYEKAIRHEAVRRSGARLHVNLHGYPAHEWTRPLTGYIPRNFALWTIPKGFFLILRHHAGWAAAAEALLDRVTRDLAEFDGLVAWIEAQRRQFETYAGAVEVRMVNGLPCHVSADDRGVVPVTLITEYPDETIRGDAYRRGVAVQKATVLAAYRAWQAVARAGLAPGGG
ncbi:peptidase M14 [Prosthecodimorpha staleyi]|uniref:Peptidase M14 n=1 Tax=Prosthecodimorpha staleyi TaxID=2840188 RepID=A0A947DBR6_9HYPH|nr:peptidase M14 [Prosthecodimorpha staleyi]MBT9292887.1 peptidase M14 [Prosthecodimorpha staleyi]